MALRPCPDCKNLVSRKAPICPKCGRTLKKPTRQYGCVSGCFLVLALAMVAAVFYGALGPRSPERPKPFAARNAPRERVPLTGDLVVVNLPGGSGVFIAVDDAAWDEMLDAENAKDTQYIRELMQIGKVFHVPNGTRARIIESATFSRKVRVIEGEMSEAEGWVQSEYVRLP